MKMTFKNTQLFYTAKGTGNPLVFLHGFLESSRIWEPFTEALAQKRQVICIDLPGHGQSGVIEEVHSMELMAAAVHAVLQQLKVKSATLLGHSMGGYVALAFCENYPGKTSGLVLLNSTPLEDTLERKKDRERAINLVERNKRAYVTMAITNLLSPENRKKFKKETAILKEEALQISDIGITAALKGMKIRTDKTEVLKEFNKIKIIVSGLDDPLIPINIIENTAKSSNCQFISMPGGHLSYIECFTKFRNFVHFID